MTQVAPLQETLERARALAAAKMAALEKLVEIRCRMYDLEVADAAAHAEMLRAGWTEDELRRLSIAPPARRAPGRPRGRRKTPEEYVADADRRIREAGGNPNALVRAQVRREAEASVALDRDQTHAVGEPVGA